MLEKYQLIGICLILILAVDCQTSAKIELISSIKIKLKNGQVLIGNRKLVSIEESYAIKRKIVYEFLGIPFAKAPINQRRFQFPYRLDNILTKDEYNATFYRPSCWQEYDETFSNFRGSEMWNPPFNISEDCLYFNIWVPVTNEQDKLLFKENDYINYQPNAFKTPKKDLKSTLFWIYGGSFNSGSSNLEITDGTILASSENVLVVSSNYRVGPFGFLYLNNSLAPGNSGLADQVLAIEWYRENYLDFFGGSPDKVCLFGESAGSMSIHFLLLTNKSNIFNRGILQSLSSYSDIGFRTPEEAFRVSLQFAQKVGCLTIDENNSLKKDLALNLNISFNDLSVSDENLTQLQNQIFNCILKLDSNTLSLAQFEIDYVIDHLKMQFLPTIDFNKLIEKNPLEYNFEDFTKNHELLLGVNYDEATYFTFYYYYQQYFDLNDFLKPTLKYDNEFVYQRVLESLKFKQVPEYKIVDVKLDKKPRITISNKHYQNEKVKDHFYKKFMKCLSDFYTNEYNEFIDTNGSKINFNLDSNDNNSAYLAWKKYTKIIGDYIYNCPTIKLASRYHSKTFNKTYFYRFNKRSRFNPWPKWLGVLHGYEIEYVFGYPFANLGLFEDSDRKMSQLMMSYWANFASYGRLMSSYDNIPSRKYFVEFTQSNKYKNVSENDEFDWFNSDYPLCDFLNNYLDHKQTYASKYEQCLNYHSDSDPDNHKTINLSINPINMSNSF
ncbi:unnamed protein product, partial [Brachionus calyciflorus]